MLDPLANLVTSKPRAVLVLWGLLLVLALVLLHRLHGHGPGAALDALAPDQPAMRGERLARQSFPALYASSDVVLVFARRPFLSDSDVARIDAVAAALHADANDPRHLKWSVRTAQTDPFLASRLTARDPAGRPTCSLVVVSYDAEYDSDESIDIADRVELIARNTLGGAGGDVPSMELTGPGALGRDEALKDEASHHRITVASILAVLIVLMVVYRAPLAASVPLICVAASAIVSTECLSLLQSRGVPITSDELTYLVVIVFGAGTDFALFWMSRFDEELSALGAAGGGAGTPADLRRAAARRAYVATVPGIACSAGTTILGLAALLASQFQPNHVLGLSMAFALAVALAAAVTLMPALAMSMGARLFWPRRRAMSAGQTNGLWAAVARWVTYRPFGTVGMIGAMLAVPLWASCRVAYRIETDGGLTPSTSTFARGRDLAAAHFGRGTLFPWTCLVQFNSADAAKAVAAAPGPTQGVLARLGLGGGGASAGLRDLSADVARGPIGRRD